MNRTIRQLTDSLTELLPEDQQYYKLKDLRSWGFPGFIVHRIRLELERNLAESMRLPKTDWANMQSEDVQAIWKQFISAIRNQAWLPASYASAVIETAVGDVLEILVEPRKNIPDVLYGTDEKLTLQQLEKRVEVLVVYPHFGRLLPRYMRKKELETLDRERCAEIITRADRKITARYTPLNWAQLLEPLFQLYDEQIDSNLLRLFFEDKKMPRIARKFDFMDEPVDRARLIETISSPDSLNLMGFEDDQSDLFTSDSGQSGPGEEGKKASPKDKDEGSASAGNLENDSDYRNRNAERDDTDESAGKTEEPDRDEASEVTLNTIFGAELTSEEKIDEEDVQDKENAEATVPSLYNDFEEAAEPDEDRREEGGYDSEQADDFENDTEREKEGQEPASENENRSTQGEAEDSETAEEEVDPTGEAKTNRTAEEQAEKKETPMWQRFLSEEELKPEFENDSKGLEGTPEAHSEGEEDTGTELNRIFSEEHEDEGNEDYLDQPIIDLTQHEADDEEVARLHERLKPEREYFLREIFGGSEQAYDEAINEIAAKKDWRSASRYLESEVFKRNMVDMYSEQAIELTDRLHTYFLNRSDN